MIVGAEEGKKRGGKEGESNGNRKNVVSGHPRVDVELGGQGCVYCLV